METMVLRRTRATRVLIADDDAGVLHLVSSIVEREGMRAIACLDGAEAVRAFFDHQPHIAVLDVRMPGSDGVTVCRKIRAVSPVPIMVLTGLEDQKEAAHALDAGADDYVRKPFGVEEFVARLRALLRRTEAGGGANERAEAGDLVIDGGEHLATFQGHELPLTPTEFALLQQLVRHRGRVLTQQQLLQAVWGPEYVDTPHMLHVSMSRLRQKLAARGATPIRTLPRIGYRFSDSDGGRPPGRDDADGAAAGGGAPTAPIPSAA